VEGDELNLNYVLFTFVAQSTDLWSQRTVFTFRLHITALPCDTFIASCKSLWDSVGIVSFKCI